MIMFCLLVLKYSQAVYSVAHCRKLGSMGYYLYGDLDIRCYSQSHSIWVIVSSIVGGFYVLGTPLLLVYTLHRRRDTLNSPATRQYLGVIYNGYRLKYYWWEAILMLRKTAIIGCIITLYSYGEGVQITAIQFVLVTCMSTELIIEPFAKKEARDLERLSLVIQIFSFICTGFFNRHMSITSFWRLCFFVSMLLS